jgi:hypothetical protein
VSPSRMASLRLSTAAALVASLSACAAPGPGAPQSAAGLVGDLRLEVVSGRPTTVTAGTALVRVHLPEGVAPEAVRLLVTHGGAVTDVSRELAPEADGRSLLAMVTGLADGESFLEAEIVAGGLAGGRDRLRVVNHPAHGPVFSGPHQQPFFCRPEESGLGPEHDAFCHVAAPVVEYFYRDAESGGFLPLQDPGVVPEGVARTTTTEGLEVPFIVRNERGTLNRGIYNIAVLHDPAEAAWGDPRDPQRQWNRRLFFQLEGACRPGYSQDRERAEDILSGGQAAVLGAGYAVGRHTFTRHGNACGNDPLSSESMMMVREHFTVHYGEPLHMIGNGGSGGAILQYLTADNYPGILDGIIAASTFPDAYSIASGAGDAPLLHRAFATSAHWPEYDEAIAARFPAEWSPDLEARLHRLRAVSGFGSWALNLTWLTGNSRNVDPSIYVGRYVPEDQLYHPELNPGGIRATIYEAGRNVWGTDPETGFARRPVDNVGVQYGLLALEAGVITPEEFVELNERVGGLDIDGRHVPERMDAPEDLVALAYRTGRVLNGGMGLAEVPMLNLGVYQDLVELGADYHDRFRDFSVRARLLRENGHFDNHVMWHAHPRAIPPDFTGLEPLRLMDAWVTAIGSDTRDVPRARKVIDHRPAGLTDRCTLPDGSHHTGTQWPPEDAANPCIRELPPAGDPRIAAGTPIANDVIKCRLKPLARADYGVEFTAAQWQRMEQVFPGGVCDWERPGVGQQPPIGTWLHFDSPGRPQRIE